MSGMSRIVIRMDANTETKEQHEQGNAGRMGRHNSARTECSMISAVPKAGANDFVRSRSSSFSVAPIASAKQASAEQLPLAGYIDSATENPANVCDPIQVSSDPDSVCDRGIQLPSNSPASRSPDGRHNSQVDTDRFSLRARSRATSVGHRYIEASQSFPFRRTIEHGRCGCES